MKNILILFGLLLSFSTFSQPYQEEDFYGFWRQDKTIIKNAADREKLPGYSYHPINIHYYNPDHTFMYVVFGMDGLSLFNINHSKSKWELQAEDQNIKLFNPQAPKEFTLLPIHKFKPGKKLELIHKTEVLLENRNSVLNTVVFDTAVIELVVKFEKCTKEEALNVSMVDGIYVLNKEVSKVEWREYAYDLELKDEIVFRNEAVGNESMAQQFDPVLNVSQQDALAFCNWKARQIKTYYDLDVVVRLPTISEWDNKLSSSLKDGSQYRMQGFSYEPDLDSYYLKKPVKLLKDIYEWCAEEGMVYSIKYGSEPVSAASANKTGFRYVIEFL